MKAFGFEISRTRETVAESTVEKAAAPKAKTAPMGFIGLKTSSGKVEEEFLKQLQWPDAGKVYQEMASNDAVIGGCLYLIETLIRKANWGVEAASEDPGDVEAAEFVKSCMFDMSDQSWDDFICEVLTMLPYGFSFHEIVYKTRRGPFERDPKFKSNYSDGRIGWQELPGRSQATLSEWTFDESTGKATEFVQDPSLTGGKGNVVKIPIEGNLLFKTKTARGNPEGWSILRRAYRSWYFKRYIEELEGIGIERNLAGIPVLQPPEEVPLFDPNNEEMKDMLAWAQQLVNSLRQDKNHGLVLPGAWSLKLMGTEGSSKTMDTDTIIRRHGNCIAMSMLSDVVMMGGDRTGSFALSETKQGLLMSSLQAIINSIASTLNTHAIPMLFAVNGWQLEKLPKIKAGDLQPVTIKEVALLLRTFKVDVTKDQKMFNFLMGLIQAPTMTDDEFAAFMAQQTAAQDYGNGEDPDSIDNDLKQQGENYTGMEGE